MMHVVARLGLVKHVPADGRRRLLLEGSWPAEMVSNGDCASLDDEIDARYEWIDVEAARLAEHAIQCDVCEGNESQSFSFVNTLRMRYAFVKWLRVLAWRRITPLPDASTVTLHVSTSKQDEEYVALLKSVAATDRITLEVRRYPDEGKTAAVSLPPNAAWRTTLAKWATGGIKRTVVDSDSPRVLLCGNPRILGPLCDDYLRRKITTAWLFDRFAVRPWLRWGLRGASVLTCDAPSASTAAVYEFGGRPTSIRFDDVDLSPVIQAWHDHWVPQYRNGQNRQRNRIAAHVAAFQPTHVVVDEDATPLPRMVIAAARRRGAASSVIQHGACGVRFGFTPLLADRIVVNGKSSRRQLEQWGVAGHRIVEEKSGLQERFVRDVVRARDRITPTRMRNVLLIGTTPARDERPDAVAFHLTTRAYEQLLTQAFTVVQEMGDATLVVRPHPRTGEDRVFQAVRRRFPALKVRVSSRREQLADQAAAADLVLSCASSAGIDIALAGRPVIQLLPHGSGEILPAEWYGMLGSARSLDDLRRLVRSIDAAGDPATIEAQQPKREEAAHV